METKMWRGDSLADLQAAAECLRRGELVAFPTETVYGLGANAFDAEADRAIYRAKGRPSDNPLIVHIYALDQLAQLTTTISPVARQLMAAFWPGALTLVLPKSAQVPDCITGGLDSVAVRMPSHPVARALLELTDLPVAAPSANTSGKPSPTLAEHVWHDLAGKVAGIIDGGATTVGLESTVLDLTTAVPTILRPGGVTQEQLEAVIGEVQADATLGRGHSVPKAPGMKYTHYAPDAPVKIVAGTDDAVVAQLRQIVADATTGTDVVGLMLSQETAAALPLAGTAVKVRIMGSKQHPDDLARALFASLRWFDGQRVDVIYTENFATENIGSALMNRLYKAAGVAP